MSELCIEPDEHCLGALPIPLGMEDRLRWQDSFNEWPAMERLGLLLDLSHPVAGRFCISEVQPYHLGGVGDASKGGGRAINGAIIAGMFDAALGVAGVLQLPGRRAGTVDLSIKMFRAVSGRAIVFGWAVKRTTSLVFAEAVLIDHRGVRCAQASGIVSAADGPAAGGHPDSHVASDVRAAYTSSHSFRM